MVNYWLTTFVTQVKRVGRNVFGYRFLPNATRVDELGYKKRALFVYVTKPFTIAFDNPVFLSHQNLMQARQIAVVLNELGYVVDVVHLRDVRFKPRRKYDILISHRVSLE